MEDPIVVVVSYSGKEINAKLVYYGAGLSGKTTNLESIYEAVPETSRGKMVSMKTQSDRTLFFDLLPLDLGEIMGFKTRFLLYTVPGQVFYNATRKLVLKGADAIVFVADSEVGKMDENKESLANLRANLTEYGLRLDEIPWVIQYNKRDLPEVYSVEELNAELNPDGKFPFFEAVATQGKGVFETFRGISHLLMDKVTRELRRTPAAGGAGRSARQDDSAARTDASSLGVLSTTPSKPVHDHAGESEETAHPTPPAAAPRSPAPTPAPAPVAETVQYGRELSLPASAPVASGEGSTGSGAAIVGQSDRGLSAEATPLGAVRDLSSTTPKGSIPMGGRGATGFGTSLDLESGAPASTPERPGVTSLELTPLAPPAPKRGGSTPQTTGTQSRDEIVVPVSLPRGATREIVLRIVLTHEQE
jgi:hypothetical protein